MPNGRGGWENVLVLTDCENYMSTILVAECPSVRDLIGAILEKERYSVVLTDPDGAMGVLERQSPGIDLVITNEPWSFESCRSAVPVLYISGAPDRDFMARHRGKLAFLQKPFRYQALLASVKSLLREVVGR